MTLSFNPIYIYIICILQTLYTSADNISPMALLAHLVELHHLLILVLALLSTIAMDFDFGQCVVDGDCKLVGKFGDGDLFEE